MSDYLPPVVARLSMDLGDFADKIAEARAMIRELNGDAQIDVKINVDNDRIAALSSRLADLYRQNQNLTVKPNVEDGAAKAELAVLTRDRTVDVKVNVDKSSISLLDRLGGIGAGLTGGLLNSAAQLGPMAIGPLSVGAGATGVAGIAAIVAAAAAALPILDMLVSGLAAAGAGAIAFGAMSYPAITSVSQAYSNLKTAQDALTQAQLVYKADPSTQNAQALRQAQDAVKGYEAQIKQLPAAQQTALQGINQLMNAGSKIQQAFQPTAFQVFNAGLRVLNSLMPAVLPMAQAFGNALTGLLNQLNKFANSPQFQTWLHQFTALIGPSVTAIGQGVGQIAIAFGKLLTIFSAKDIATAIHVFFDVVVGALNGIRLVIEGLVVAWHWVQSSVESFVSATEGDWNRLVGVAKAVVSGVVGAFNSLVSSAMTVYHNVVSAWDSMLAGITSVGGKIISFAQSIPGRIVSALGDVGSLLLHAGEAIMEGLLHGLETGWNAVSGFVSKVAGWISSLKGPLDYDRQLLVPHGQAIMNGLMAGMDSRMPALRAQLAGITSTMKAGWTPDMLVRAGAIGPTGGYGGAGGQQAVIEVHSHVYLDSREIYGAVQVQSADTQRRTGHSGLTRRTR